jgi:hypothetical protein
MSSTHQVIVETTTCPHTAVVNYGVDNLQTHEAVCHTEFAKQIATLIGIEFAGRYDRTREYSRPLYFVPSDTLLISEAHELGIQNEQDLFGGVVPASFVATKAISHSLVDANAYAPGGWSYEFGVRVRNVVHRGFAAFCLDDARRAGARLLNIGPIRIKPTRATGAHGQRVISEASALSTLLDEIEEAEVREYGLAVEENLTGVRTYSVGQAQVAGLQVAYYGTQRLTSNNDAASVYGGSDLFFVRGDLETLLRHKLEESVCLAIHQARAFDAAARELFPEMFASRRNYDVAQGWDSQGNWRSGVLEQSWRIGGATGAELAALEAFQSDAELDTVRASCVEIYGSNDRPLPCHARIHFQGADNSVGPITKYTIVHGKP